jgi:hypothetical protein
MRIKGSERREKLYIIGCILAAILLFGTVGGLDCNTISLEQGIWQTVWSMILGLWCFNGIRLEENRRII